MRISRYDDLIEKYENPIEHACDLKEGQVFIANGWEKPEGLCDSAWDSISPFVMTLSHGGENFYNGWMKNSKTAMISCNDGFRTVSFYIEALDENADTIIKSAATINKNITRRMIMLKKTAILLIVSLMMLFSINVFAVDSYGGYDVPIDIDINGDFIKCARKPILIKGTTYIPLRAFSDAIGGSVEWDENENAATMKKDGHTFVFYPDKEYCLIDGAEKNHPSVMYKDLTFIPVRAVSEVLNYDVSWDGLYLSVKIVAPGVDVTEGCKDKLYTYEDILYLGKIIQIESGYSPFEVKLGVGGVVFNRVKTAGFPDTVKNVIFDTNYGVQFPPVHTDMINTTPSSESIIAAKCVLNGVNIVGNSIYFIEMRNAHSSWVHNNRPHYTNIHSMSFYE